MEKMIARGERGLRAKLFRKHRSEGESNRKQGRQRRWCIPGGPANPQKGLSGLSSGTLTWEAQVSHLSTPPTKHQGHHKPQGSQSAHQTNMQTAPAWHHFLWARSSPTGHPHGDRLPKQHG
jgi:hypothetical protein